MSKFVRPKAWSVAPRPKKAIDTAHAEPHLTQIPTDERDSLHCAKALDEYIHFKGKR
jgi:hypothetical protein